eukprot:8158017-Pyramimonas_sp.AAC.1
MVKRGQQRRQGGTRAAAKLVTDDSHLRHVFGVRKYFGGESNSPVVGWLKKGLTTVFPPQLIPAKRTHLTPRRRPLLYAPRAQRTPRDRLSQDEV